MRKACSVVRVLLALPLVVAILLLGRNHSSSDSSDENNRFVALTYWSESNQSPLLLAPRPKHDPPKPPSVNIPTITIGTDVHGWPVRLPLLGAGTWQYNDTTAYDSVCQALQTGYTLVDTAFGYRNQRGVGRALRNCYHGKRGNLFLLTKVPGGLTQAETLAHMAQDLFALNVEFVDHVMLHFPADWDGTTMASKEIRQAQWQALEQIYYAGKARSIGVSHYCTRHLQDILEIATVMPSINQVEYHVGSGDIDHVRNYCRQQGIAFMSFSPLCGPCQLQNPQRDSLVTGTVVTDIGQRYNKTGAQVALRFIVQQALHENGTMAGVIPKSNNPAHIAANMDIFDWTLSDNDMELLLAAKQPAAQAGDCDVP